MDEGGQLSSVKKPLGVHNLLTCLLPSPAPWSPCSARSLTCPPALLVAACVVPTLASCWSPCDFAPGILLLTFAHLRRPALLAIAVCEFCSTLLHCVLSGLPLALLAPAASAPLPVFLLLLLLLMLIVILLTEKKPTLDEVEVMMHVRGWWGWCWWCVFNWFRGSSQWLKMTSVFYKP